MAVAAPVLSVLLRQWHQVRPAVQARLTSGRARDMVDLVRRRELDLALVDGPVTDTGLDSAPVIEDRLMVVLPADHPLAQEETVGLRSLRRERFVGVARRSSVSLHDRLIELCGAAGFNPDVGVEVDDPELLPVAVAAGLGVGLAATGSTAGGAMPGLVCRPVADAGATIPFVLVSVHDGVTTQTREFLLLVENLRHRSRVLSPSSVEVTELHRARPSGVQPVRRALQYAV